MVVGTGVGLGSVSFVVVVGDGVVGFVVGSGFGAGFVVGSGFGAVGSGFAVGGVTGRVGAAGAGAGG